MLPESSSSHVQNSSRESSQVPEFLTNAVETAIVVNLENNENLDSNIDIRINDVRKKRKLALTNLEKQAEMLKFSNSKYPSAKLGNTVRIRVPDVDRARSDQRNLLAIVTEITEKKLYKLGTKYGILNQLYSRNQFTVCKEKFISIEEIPDTEISLRECARKSSNCGGQGYSRCGCKDGCKSDKCVPHSARHLMTGHADENQVQIMLALPKGSKKRREQIGTIKKQNSTIYKTR
ncbi:uncharacterized protein LOC114341037 [Diabrotica virgifera virgifera]|uniref:KRAB-A domain-containing protein 2-like n=1 Tax=Diabrotica virgifera virgifera TaxID=50390 RepID=A0ABM5IXR4_DIAVI|nr:uncharacterized protein LOC114341037 [Diabrotica virgifera virgifera]